LIGLHITNLYQNKLPPEIYIMRVENYSDTELIVQLQKDDIKAYNQLYFKYHSAIYRNIFKLVKDAEETENILQEVFIALWINRLKLAADKPVANWLFVVSYNKSLTYLKKALKASITFTKIERDFPDADEMDAFLKEARLQLITEACSSLSPQKRKVFDLCKIQGKTYEETALELNISKHTVKEYLSMAVKNVKEYVDQHPDNHLACIYLLVILKVITH